VSAETSPPGTAHFTRDAPIKRYRPAEQQNQKIVAASWFVAVTACEHRGQGVAEGSRQERTKDRPGDRMFQGFGLNQARQRSRRARRSAAQPTTSSKDRRASPTMKQWRGIRNA